MSDIYTSTYCNFGHDVKTGKPIGHECVVIPPKALAAEIAGNYDRAIELMEAARKAGKLRIMRRGMRSKDLGELSGRKRKFPGDYNIEFHVHEGQPSWHQRRAGHISAAVTTGFKTREDAEAFADKLRKRGTSAFVVEAHSEKELVDLPRWAR